MRTRQAINGALRRVPVWLAYLLGLAPAPVLLWLAATGGLGPDPVKALEHQLGEIGLIFLVAVLAVTPLLRLTGINLMRFRRSLGLMAFWYVLFHLSCWLILDMQFDWPEIWTDITKRPYITIGMAAFLAMLPLALTSNDYALRRMGAAAWRRLHRLAYFVALAGAVHYFMLVKAWPVEPLLFLVVILLLLGLRLRWRKLHSSATLSGAAPAKR